MTALDDIAAERQRQVEKEGWTLAHDDEHSSGEMAAAAAIYAMDEVSRKTIVSAIAPHWRSETILARLWPWSWDWWKPRDRRQDLVRAGALIVAEIERIDRLS